MGDAVIALGLFGLGLALWWGGYYVALVSAWRSGVRGVGIALAMPLGICGCGGIPILGVHWQKMQQVTFDAIASGADAALWGARMRRFQLASGIAFTGMVMQVAAGYVMPDDDGADADSAGDAPVVDDGEWEPPQAAHAEDAYAYASDDPVGDEPVAADPVVADEPDDLPAEVAESLRDDTRVSGVLIGTTDDRRHAFVLDPAGGRWVRRARGALPRLEPGSTVHAIGTTDDDGELVTDILEDAGISPWLGMPRPERLEGAELASPPSARIGRWVLVPSVRAVDARTVASTADPTWTLRVRAPRGMLRADTTYVALRGALVDTRPVDRRGGIELWIVRASDVIAE